MLPSVLIWSNRKEIEESQSWSAPLPAVGMIVISLPIALYAAAADNA